MEREYQEVCPTCGHRRRFYRRTIHHEMLTFLRAVAAQRGWIHSRQIIGKKAPKASSDASYLVHWKLVEKGGTGMYRATKRGRDFLAGVLMGTNYYFNPTKHPDASFHIGKSSAGWRFLVRVMDQSVNGCGIQPHSFKEWLLIFEANPGVIVSEYGGKVSVLGLCKIIDTHKDMKSEAPWKSGDRWVRRCEGWDEANYEFS